MESITSFLKDLETSLGSEASRIIVALIVLIIGYFAAKLLSTGAKKVISLLGVDDKLNKGKVKLSKFIGQLVYIIVMIFVFTLALEKMGMREVLDPVKIMLENFIGFIPNVIGALLVGYIGYMLAGIVSELVGFSGNAIKSFAPKLKIPENIDLVAILKKIVFIFIFIPLLISAFEILQMEAISKPASEMLSTFFNAIPKVFLATLILIIALVLGRFISGLVKDLLNTLNLNSILDKFGLDEVTGEKDFVNLIGSLVNLFIVVFGLTTAVEKLEFAYLSEILFTVISYGGAIIFGLVILGIGNWISILASKQFSKTNENTFVAGIIRAAVLLLFIGIGLRAMGIADDIINLFFGITLAAIALTVVLSFGLGGREAGGEMMKEILSKFKSNKNSKED